MSFQEPQITMVARVFAAKVNESGEEAVQEWRKSLRQARLDGSIDELAVRMAITDIEDDELQNACVEVVSGM